MRKHTKYERIQNSVQTLEIQLRWAQQEVRDFEKSIEELQKECDHGGGKFMGPVQHGTRTCIYCGYWEGRPTK